MIVNSLGMAPELFTIMEFPGRRQGEMALAGPVGGLK